MFDEENATLCSVCGKDLSELNDPKDPFKRIPCPDCGSTIRSHFLTIKCGIGLSVAVSSEIKDNTGFVKQEDRTWQGYSEKSNRPVIISKVIDRTDPNYTKFHHKVEEWDEHGIIKRTIHEHTDVAPAKHRPKNEGEDL